MHGEVCFDDNFTLIRKKLRQAFLQLANIWLSKNSMYRSKNKMYQGKKIKEALNLYFCKSACAIVKDTCTYNMEERTGEKNLYIEILILSRAHSNGDYPVASG